MEETPPEDQPVVQAADPPVDLLPTDPPVDPTMDFPGEVGQEEDPEVTNENTFFVYHLAFLAAISGLLFGYDTGIISGALLNIQEYFRVSSNWLQLIANATLGAAAVSSLLAGYLCDLLGRRITIMMGSIVFYAGGVWMAVAESGEMFLVGRVIVGIAIGVASMTVPLYVAEASPPSIRGRLVTLNYLFLTIGIVMSGIVAWALNSIRDGWRYMLGLACIPGLFQFVGFFCLPESPRYLVSRGRVDKARQVLQRIRNRKNVNKELGEIFVAVKDDKNWQGGWILARIIKTPHVRKALYFGCALHVFQQLCGVNAVIYYSATILRMVGLEKDDSMWPVTVTNSIMFLATSIGLAYVEKLGRKKLLIISLIGVGIALVLLASGFQLMAQSSPEINKTVMEFYPDGTEPTDSCYNSNFLSCQDCIDHHDCGFCYLGDGNQGSCVLANDKEKCHGAAYGRCTTVNNFSSVDVPWSHGYCATEHAGMAVSGLALFVFAFASGLGPMPWTINAEIHPLWARSTCVSIATSTHWVCNLLVSIAFMNRASVVSNYGSFWMYAGVCLFGMLFTIAFVPETKNKTLEEVKLLFMGKSDEQPSSQHVARQENRARNMSYHRSTSSMTRQERKLRGSGVQSNHIEQAE